MGAAHVWILLAFFLNLSGAVGCVLAASLLWRKDSARRERAAMIGALGITAAWCVAVAAWGSDTITCDLLESARNLSWIVVVYRLFANDGRDQSLSPIRPLVVALGFVECL